MDKFILFFVGVLFIIYLLIPISLRNQIEFWSEEEFYQNSIAGIILISFILLVILIAYDLIKRRKIKE